MYKQALIASIAWMATVALAQSPNRIPQDQAKDYAKLCSEKAATMLADAQVTIEVDADKPCAERGEGGGAMILPDKKLTEKVLANIGKDVVPVGQLWLRKWTLAVDGKPIANDKLRVVIVNVEEKDRPMPLLLLGVRKKGEKDLELVVYGKGAEPIQVLPLTKVETSPTLPLEVDWSRGEKDIDNLSLNVLGKYQTGLKIARQEK